MAATELGMGKSIAVLAVVVGCFTILWPKIFYPMMQAAFSMTSPDYGPDDDSYRGPHPAHIMPGQMHMKEGMGQERPNEKSRVREGRPFPHPSVRQPPKQAPKTGGAMNFIMPLYTIGIVLFFLYTVLKLVCKKKPEDEAAPQAPDYHYEKHAPQDNYIYNTNRDLGRVVEPKKRKTRSLGTKQLLEEIGRCREGITKGVDERDLEISRLRRRLEETEYLMEQIMRHMKEQSPAFQDGELFSVSNDAKMQGASSSKKDGKLRRRKHVGVHKSRNTSQEENNYNVALEEGLSPSQLRPSFTSRMDRIEETKWEGCAEETDDSACSDEDADERGSVEDDRESQVEGTSSDEDRCHKDS
ncbi:resistance to inhibitors of cholinesterase protein 3-like isoform X1 [Ornithodoros turicata]|uniref:resistance to inhibitors of cholinesterase protein 3-like isoform X1 n=1 Tax=Ornithodoros turicata TaxID=34597 RepID=UPI003138D25F